MMFGFLVSRKTACLSLRWAARITPALSSSCIKCDLGQIPSHIPWYIGQLDANMQTAAGALVNEGVPGMDSKTATGAELMNQASNQHNAPECAQR